MEKRWIEIRCCCDPGRLLGWAPIYREAIEGMEFTFTLSLEIGYQGIDTSKPADEIMFESITLRARPIRDGKWQETWIALDSNHQEDKVKRIVGFLLNKEV